jgi:hypothetical protein
MITFRRFLKRLWLPIILRCWPLAQLWYRGWGLNLDGYPDDEVGYFALGAYRCRALNGKARQAL